MKNCEDNSKGISRRDFIKVTSAAGASALFNSNILAKPINLFSTKKPYVIVGTGHRAQLWLEAILDTYKDTCEVVGLCDTNLGRMKYYQNLAKKYTDKNIPLYDAKDFMKMVNETKPDTVIVTTMDSTHHEYICKALELGCNVITEKPMTNTAEKCQAIIDAKEKHGKNITVSFNYRYSPARTQVKDLLMKGEIGDILSIDFHWMLNTHHGADYFRRWHGLKKYSNGLLLHKSTHHFDLVNWWLSAIPVKVTAMSKKDFYTPVMAKRIGLNSYHERCHTCEEKQKCAFELDLSKNERLKALYLDNENYDGYFRDKCVFRPEIDIEDTMNVIAQYDNNVTLSYSLNAFNSWEGYYIMFNGTKGRIEHKIEEKVYVAGDGTVQGGIKSGGESTKIFPIRGAAYNVDVWKGVGGHGGGDALMLDDIFNSDKKYDKYLRCADERSGAYSLLTGVAANISVNQKKEVIINDLVKNLKRPDYPVMPDHSISLPMPSKR